MHPLASSFQTALQCLTDLCQAPNLLSTTESASDLLAQAFQEGKKVLICGNGGSACDGLHFAEELTGRYRQNRPALPAISLTDPGHLTCVANDFGFAEVFARSIEALGQPGDVLIVLSTSGNSPNILRAIEAATTKHLKVLALLGKDGGRCHGKASLEWIVPGTTTDRIQELHMLILHILVEGIERRLFPNHYKD